MSSETRGNVMHDLVLPTILFMSIGGMTWAVRGCAGFGAASGCIFAGVMLSTAWWYIARDPAPVQSRRYASGWIILAMTIGFGIAGTRGWMQWPHFFNKTLYLDYQKGEFVPISKSWGFLWMFLAGVPWAGIPACMLAWCASGRRTQPLQWIVRLTLALGGAWFLGVFLYYRNLGWFLPLYDELYSQYQHPEIYPNIKKLIRDNHEAMMMMGFYLGCLIYELGRRDWKNVVLILTVGLLNGIGWALLQNWMWADDFWPGAQFNFWRAWETTGGVSIGIAFGVAYYLVNRPMSKGELEVQTVRLKSGRPTVFWLGAFIVSVLVLGWPEFYYVRTDALHWFFTEWITLPFPLVMLPCAAIMIITIAFGIAYFLNASKTEPNGVWSIDGPILEKWAVYAGLILGLGLSIQNGLRGWAIIYLDPGNEQHYRTVLAWIFLPLMIVALIAVSNWLLQRGNQMSVDKDPFPRAYGLLWLVIIVQNVIAQLITNSLSTNHHGNWQETVYSIYYVLLFLMTVPIVYYYYFVKKHGLRP